MARTARPGARVRYLGLLVLAASGVAAQSYFLGLAPGDAGLTPQAERRALLAAGARMIELPVRWELWDQPGGRAQADAAVAELLAAGCRPMLLLAPGDQPDGLFEPVFTGGSDWATIDSTANPANPWAGFVLAVAERYDGDGVDDAPGSPKVGHLCFGSVPFRDGRFAWPGGVDAVARMIAVGRAAARQAEYTVRVGYEPGSFAALEALLAQEAVPLASGFDFLGYEAGTATGSDEACYGPSGMVTLADDIKALFRRANGYPPRLVCRGVAVGDTGRVQRAAAAKVQLVAAAEGLLSARWRAAWEPAPSGSGLVEDPRGLPEQGDGWRRRDAYYAMLTVDRLLGEGLAGGTDYLDRALTVGNDARAYRFDCLRGELVVAWAYDADGDPERRVTVRLPLRAGEVYHRCRWDFSRTGRAEETVRVGPDGYLAELGIDPEYFLMGDPPLCAPAVELPAAPAEQLRYAASEDSGGAPLAADGRLETAWRRAGAPRCWWRIEADAALTAERLRLFVSRGAGRSVIVETSADGELWREIARASLPDGGGWAEVGFGARVSSRWWRLIFALPAGQELALAEVELPPR